MAGPRWWQVFFRLCSYLTMADEMNATDWISAISSLAAAIIGIVTLLTVYIGAMQLLSQNRMYRLGLSWRSLGPWQTTVAKWALFGLQRRISSPTVSLKFLVKAEWKPNLIFPVGFSKSKDACVEKAESLVQANTSWVNFMQALGLSPTDSRLYEIQGASELVNGIVPMSWTGKDLVGMCSILGFQSHEDSPSFKSPMPLPMQWSGPLGWLQFRSSTNGCIAEFRCRMPLHNQISAKLHDYYNKQSPHLPREVYSLRSRLWNSINGFVLANNQALYLGGTDRFKRPQQVDDDPELKQEDLLDDLMANDHSDEEIMRLLFGKKDKQPKALRREVERNGPAMSQRAISRGDDDIPDFLDAMLRDKLDSCKMKQQLRPSPGLLSVSVQGELAYNRGLSVTNCREYEREYVEDVDHKAYPHNLGDLYMGWELLELVKEALMLLRPDGFYFSPTYHLYRDICEVYHDIQDQSNVIKEVFPSEFIPVPQKEVKPNRTTSSGTNSTASSSLAPESKRLECLRVAMDLCNELQRTRKKARACFSVGDMRLLAKAASVLRDVFLKPKTGDSKHEPQDLAWAMLYCGKLSRSILKAVKRAPVSEFLTTRVICKDGVLDCEAIGRVAAQEGDHLDLEDWRFDVPLVANGEFTGEQVVAAVAVTFITYYWIDKEWITDVAVYDNTIPQSVLMC
ncbi:hypothetical protein CEP52_004208 [Fusarium oligoseptatum]|uniref:Uncharacterized protein n=1 Tax=Fusarium oligoseptatum TaxID=2604345 RepID=A0A428U569_9HYPO|nr:hypothetical protein CEP52_004208 [Fusarium oligoseptatum]